MKKDLLEQIGLNDNETRVYRLLLTEGPKTPPEISNISGITRANSYFVLQALISKGLVERKEVRKKFLYSLLDPEKLGLWVEQEKRSALEKENILAALLPDLQNLYNMQTNKPSVSYFEGLEGIKRLYNDSLIQKPEEILVFRSPLDDESLTMEFAQKHSVKLKKNGTKVRMISPSTKTGVFTEINGEKMLRDIRYMGKSFFDSEISIYNNRVAIVTYGKTKVSMLVENKELANTLRTVFDLVWKSLK
jgi:sugar-specific transcriptional regulator TrmB